MEATKCPCAFDNNGRFLALLTPDGRLKVWDCTNGSLKNQYTPSSHLSTTCACLKWCNSSRNVEQTPRRKKQKTAHHSTSVSTSDIIALGTTSGDILLYSLSAGEVHKKLEGGHSSKVNDVEWSRNGELYSCSSDKYIVEWCTEKAEHKSKWKADKHGVSSLRVSPLGNHLLSAGRTIKLWDLDTKELLKKFTGHSSIITDLLFLPNPTSSDSNGNHVSDSTINGWYFLSSAEHDRLLNIWYIELETKAKNSLISLSLTDEPISIDVTRHDTRPKPVHISVVTKDGRLHLFEKSLNGGGKKPLLPSRTIQLKSADDKAKSPISFICAKLTQDDDPSVIVAYGSSVKPHFETMTYSSMEQHTVLERSCGTTLQIQTETQPTGPLDKSAKSLAGATTLGPTSMTLARPAVAAQAGGNGLKNDQLEKSLEEKLQVMNKRMAKKKKISLKALPTTSSVVQMLTQALHSQDKHLLEDVLMSSTKSSLVQSTVQRLPVTLVVPFISELVFRIQVSPNRGSDLSVWLKHLLSVHMSYLMTIPNLVESLSSLYAMMETRVGVYGKLCKLQGRLDLLLSQVAAQQESDHDLRQPATFYQEEDSESEDDVHLDGHVAGDDSSKEEKWDEGSDDDDDDSSVSADDDSDEDIDVHAGDSDNSD
ncbi:WD repeat-containing protein 43 [Nematostella vectensis]|uniref:WD repeat-containing protein 43 n=1 Tax=Nematostella vectensis TaxID=45351 RepID=UPI00139040F6|nr:WD repeat-containing protein 43 [Nematostella vectensis]